MEDKLPLFQFSSVVSCVSLFVTPWAAARLPVHHKLSALAKTHAHRASDAIQPSHLLLSPFSPAFNLSQHQGPLQGVSSLHQVAKVFEFQLQNQSLQWIFRTDFPLGLTSLILQFKGLTGVFSNTTVQKNQFFGTQLSLYSNSHMHAWLMEK